MWIIKEVCVVVSIPQRVFLVLFLVCFFTFSLTKKNFSLMFLPFSKACRILILQPGTEPAFPSVCKYGVLTSEPPRKPPPQQCTCLPPLVIKYNFGLQALIQICFESSQSQVQYEMCMERAHKQIIFHSTSLHWQRLLEQVGSAEPE